MKEKRLNFKSFGEGEPVIILHGLFGMLDNWQSFAKKLSEHYLVYVIDQRDHGKSPHTDEFNYKVLAEDLKEFLDQEMISKAKFIGHSMGGKTLIQFAMDFEDYIEKMIIVDMGIKKYPGGHETIISAMRTASVGKADSRSEIESHLAQTIDNSSIRLFLMKNLQRNTEEGGFRWKMNLELLHREYQSILSSLESDEVKDTEVLFVKGLKSEYLLEEDEPKIKEQFAKAKFKEIDAGHWIHAEKPKELLEMVVNFFDV